MESVPLSRRRTVVPIDAAVEDGEVPYDIKKNKNIFTYNKYIGHTFNLLYLWINNAYFPSENIITNNRIKELSQAKSITLEETKKGDKHFDNNK